MGADISQASRAGRQQSGQRGAFQRGGRDNKEVQNPGRQRGAGENVHYTLLIICGLEATATKAAHGRRLTDEGRQSRHEGWAQIQTGRSASFPTWTRLLDSVTVYPSLSFPVT